MLLARKFPLRHILSTPFQRTFASAGVLKVDNPYSGDIFCEIPLASSKQADKIVEKSSHAQNEWKHSTLETRIQACNQFISYFEANRENVARNITNMMGKPIRQSRNEVSGLIERARKMIELAPRALEDEILPEKKGFFRKVVKEPVGVVFVVAPWNYPLLTAVNSVIPAILAGNSVVLKHSSRTPLCADDFASAFASSNAPSNLVTALHCSHGVVNHVIQNSKVGFVAFTGSVEGGHSIYQSVASKRFIDATLELGGKDPGYVRHDSNVLKAADSLIDGAFYNAGQSCCGIERIYVHESLYPSFLDMAVDFVSKYQLGNPNDENTTMGPMAQSNAPSFLQGQVSEAVQKNARLLIGGQPCTDSSGKGRFFAPAVLADCTHEMSISVEESFGPVVAIAPVKNDEEAIRLMNDSPYGLTAAIYTEDQNACERLAKRIETGTVFMNRCDYLDPELPWTGVKDTGKGISLSSHGFRGVTKLKGYHFKL